MRIYIFIISLLLFSCQEEITLDLPQSEDKIVVEGSIENGFPPYVILTKNQGYFDEIDSETYNNLFVNDIDSVKIWYYSEGEKILNHYGTQHKVKINGYMGNRKLPWDKAGPTMVGRGGGTGGPVIAVHPDCNRRFTVRETARIQSFPDDFEFFGSKSSQFRQIGNAVAVGFAYHFLSF